VAVSSKIAVQIASPTQSGPQSSSFNPCKSFQLGEDEPKPASPRPQAIMDPLTTVGSVGAVLGIIDVLGKTVVRLRELQGQYRDADFEIFSLTSQLTTLKAALTKIQEWMESESGVVHHQLVMDLRDTLSCCGMLTERLDAEISRFQGGGDGNLDFAGRIKVAFGGKSIDDLEKKIERQIMALNVLLIAYAWLVPNSPHLMQQ